MNPRPLPSGCVWLALLCGALSLAFVIVSELARAWVWLKWAFE